MVRSVEARRWSAGVSMRGEAGNAWRMASPGREPQGRYPVGEGANDVPLLILARLFQHRLGDVDRHLRGDGDGDGVARPAVHADDLAVLADAQLGEIGVLAQVV